MTIPAGMTDLFPAFSLGAVAMIGLMGRIEPAPIVRWSVVGALALVLTLYLAGQLHMWLPHRAGLPIYIALMVFSAAIIAWNWRVSRAARRR